MKVSRESDFEVVEPRAASLVESLRAFGYDLGSAVADLIDNSISASATKIWVDFTWAGKASSITVKDDGRGMDSGTLRQAMRLGSRNPNEIRDGNDLGRFGLGLKTASFSQCRCVTVFSKQAGTDECVMRWDLDHLSIADAWHVLLGSKNGETSGLEKQQSGTCVMLQVLDRVAGVPLDNCTENKDAFIQQCEEVEEYLSLVFHRILARRDAIQIFINQCPVTPTDPFFVTEATQILQGHKLRDSRGNSVLVEPFVMPHESKVTNQGIRSKAGDSRDWVARQGFYIYRQDRLLVAGSWLGFRGWRKDEHHKLARIRISITNGSDDLWQIDVTKRKASPPDQLKEPLRRIGEMTRQRAKRVYTFRGTRITSGSTTELNYVWEQVILHGRTSYRINREHPLVAGAVSSGNSGNIERLLRLIEDHFPMSLIDPNSKDEREKVPLNDDTEVAKMLTAAWHALREKGIDHSRTIYMLAAWEPFDSHPSLIAHLESNPPYP